MNTLMSLLVTIPATLSLIAAAQEATPAPLPIQVDQITGAQINVTRDSIRQLMDSIQARGGDHVAVSPDYQRAQEAFSADAARATQNFEVELNRLILTPMANLLVRYNTVTESQSFSETQRALLMSNIKNQLIELGVSLKPTYKELLKGVYSVAGNLPYDFKFKLSDVNPSRNDKGWLKPRFYGIKNGKRSKANRLEYYHSTMQLIELRSSGQGIESVYKAGLYISGFWFPLNLLRQSDSSLFYVKYEGDASLFPALPIDNNVEGQVDTNRLIARCNLAFPIGGCHLYSGYYDRPRAKYYNHETFTKAKWLSDVIATHPNAFDNVYEDLVYPAVSQGCRSDFCLTLRAADLTTYISLTFEALDKNLVLTAKDGTSFTVESPKMAHEHVLKLLSRHENPEQFPYLAE